MLKKIIAVITISMSINASAQNIFASGTPMFVEYDATNLRVVTEQVMQESGSAAVHLHLTAGFLVNGGYREITFIRGNIGQANPVSDLKMEMIRGCLIRASDVGSRFAKIRFAVKSTILNDPSRAQIYASEILACGNNQ